MAVQQANGRLVHHRCGYPLLARVLGRFEWGNAVVVEYRDGRPAVDSMLLYSCPGCGGELKLWWQDRGEQESNREAT